MKLSPCDVCVAEGSLRTGTNSCVGCEYSRPTQPLESRPQRVQRVQRDTHEYDDLSVEAYAQSEGGDIKPQRAVELMSPVCPDCMIPMEHVDDDVDLEFNVAFAVYECPSCGRTKRIAK